MKNSSPKIVNKEGGHTDVDNFKFIELVVNAKISLQNECFKDADYPATVSLLSCSGKYGYFVAGHIEGFVFGQTKDLRSTFYATQEGSMSKLENKIIVPLDFPAHQIRLSCDEQTIILALSNGTVLSYWAKDVLEQKKDTLPKHAIHFYKPIIDLRPNTGALPDSACVLFKDKECRIINWKTGEPVADISNLFASAICWSPKGKRFICGGSDGTLEHYDLKGVKQYSIPRPELLKSDDTGENIDWTVQDVLWVANDLFLVLYNRSNGAEGDGSINAAYIVDRNSTSGATPKYTRLAKLPPIVPADRAYNHFYFEIIRDTTRTIIILANNASNLISVVGQEKNGNWATWNLPEFGMASLPLSKVAKYATVSFGLALDFAACEKLPPYDASKNDSVGVDPVPVLYCLNDEGFINAFHCYDQDMARTGTKYQQMQTAVALPSNSVFSSAPFDAVMKSGYSGKGFATLEKVVGAPSPTSFGFSSITPIFGSTTNFGASSITSSSSSSSNGSSRSPSPSSKSKPITCTNSGPSSGVDAVESPNSTSSSESTSSFEMVNKKDIDDLHSKEEEENQVVPFTKKETPESNTTTVLVTNNNTNSNSNSNSNNNSNNNNNNNNKTSDPKPPTIPDANTKLITATTSSSVSVTLTNMASEMKKLGDLLKSNTPTSSKRTFGDMNNSKAPVNNATTSKPEAPAFTFGTAYDPSNNKPSAFGATAASTNNIPSTFGATTNADSIPTKAASPSTNTYPFGSTYIFGDFAPDTVTPTFSGLGKMNTPPKPINAIQQQDTKPEKVSFEESEDPYSKIMVAVEKMTTAQVSFQQQLQSQAGKLDNLTKNVEYLTNSLKKWQSMEHDQVCMVTQLKTDDIKGQGSNVSKPDSNLIKAEQTKQTLAKVEDAGDFGKLECKDGDKLLAEIQFDIKNNKEGIQQEEASSSDSSFYDFKCAIQEMEQELKKKDEDMAELKQLLALLRFREYQRKAQYSQSTIAFEDLTDDDEGDDNNAELEGQNGGSKVSPTDENSEPAVTTNSPTARRLDEDRPLDKSTNRSHQ